MLHLAKMQDMTFFYEKLSGHIAELNERLQLKPKLTFNRLHYMTEIPSGHFSLWKNWFPGAKSSEGRLPTDTEIEKLASVDILGLSVERLKAWRALDEYSVEILKTAVEEAGELRRKE